MTTAFESRELAGVKAFVCRPLEAAGFLNAFSSRPGGVSPLPDSALNLSYIGDDAANVEENRRRFLRAAGIPSYPLVTVRQTHSSVVAEAREDLSADTEADAIVATKAGLLVAVKTADCVPILLGDPVAGVSAAVHAGWRGAAANILGEAVRALTQAGADPRRLMAAIGPAACGKCFEVGPEVAEQFAALGSADALTPSGDRSRLDIPKVCAAQLRNAGVNPDNIHQSELCTMHEEGLFFSHRREAKNGKSVGRMMSVVGQRA